jgi:hypothetical protein
VVNLKLKCLAMLVLTVAIYLTIVYVNMDTILFFLISPALVCMVAVCMYLVAFALLYVSYMGQFRKITVARVLNIVLLQSSIIFLWFSFVNLIQLWPDTVVKTDYWYLYWPQDFFPNFYYTRHIVILSASLAVVCFVAGRYYKRVKSRNSRI